MVQNQHYAAYKIMFTTRFWSIAIGIVVEIDIRGFVGFRIDVLPIRSILRCEVNYMIIVIYNILYDIVNYMLSLGIDCF